MVFSYLGKIKPVCNFYFFNYFYKNLQGSIFCYTLVINLLQLIYYEKSRFNQHYSRQNWYS